MPALFELTALVLVVTAGACWLNARLLRLPLAVGLLLIGLGLTLVVAAVDRLAPGLAYGAAFGGLLARIDYPALVLNVLLAYLLFAGAMNVNLGALRQRGWAVAILATLGTLITAGIVGLGFYGLAHMVGIAMPLSWALVFGVLISPTDPIAVLAMTKRTALQEELRAQLEGEALFNDGVAVVLFRAALAYAVGSGADHLSLSGLSSHALIEAGGGAVVGLAGGVFAMAVIRAVDDWATETLVTLATATAVYALALHLHWSGPIGVVVAGLVAGSDWAGRGMSRRTVDHLHPFWRMVDEGMNAVLFLLLGLKAWELRLDPAALILAVAAPLLILAARWIAMALPTALLPLVKRRGSLALVNVLTWAGVRGGLSAAMALSLPEGPWRQPIVAATFGVVIFSIVVQSMTMERLALKTGYGEPRPEPEPYC
ncbi:MAG: sodium:proton antiporter [Proteobacteria bacterium]|nr:sodium:proton antiporter [Pseudomonadota bacterium]